MKKKLLFGLGSLFTTISLSAQEVVSSQGETYTNANASIDFTVGEVITSTESNGTNDLTQGFHQTNWNFAGVEDFAPDFEVTIFPNPTSDVLNIKSSMHENVSYLLYDGQGKLVLSDDLSGTLTQIQVNHLALGAYSLCIDDQTGQLKNFKLIKSH